MDSWFGMKAKHPRKRLHETRGLKSECTVSQKQAVQGEKSVQSQRGTIFELKWILKNNRNFLYFNGLSRLMLNFFFSGAEMIPISKYDSRVILLIQKCKLKHVYLANISERSFLS